MRLLILRWFVCLVSSGFFYEANAQLEELDSKMNALLEASNIPGFSMAIVNMDSILYLNSFGFYNIEQEEDLTIHTKHNIASLSKTFIGITLMRLVEKGILDLNSPINELLDFEIYNPKFPNQEITLAQLATHTSSINDGKIENQSFYLKDLLLLKNKAVAKSSYVDFCSWNKNKKKDLGLFLKSVLAKEGTLYNTSYFLKEKPGEKYNYSNLGAALVAYIIELKIGQPFDHYIESTIADLYGFEMPIWKHKSENSSSGYFQNKVEVPDYFSILYPSGGLYLSPLEIATFLKESIKGYNGNSDILSEEMFQQMMTPYFKGEGFSRYGIFWELKGDFIGHNGGNYGVICLMSFNKKTGIGKLLTTNISSYTNDKLLSGLVKIWEELAIYEEQF